MALRGADQRNSTMDRMEYLCARAAEEIERLQRIIDDYAAICARQMRPSPGVVHVTGGDD
jgi:hypothetical protein